MSMRKIILYSVLMVLGLCGSAQAQARVKVVTSFTILADMASNVAGDAADVESITKAGAEIHEYQPTPKDIVRAQGADLILWNGLNLERWFERFLQDVKDARNAVLTQGIEPMSIYEGDYEGKPNPHAWMSPTNALIYVENIRKALSEIDPGNAELYARNAASYSEKIKAIQKEVLEQMAGVPEDARILATSEGAFSYLARDFGMDEVYIWPINADQQGSPQQVRKVIDRIRADRIPVIFSESTISDKLARQIAAETGILYGGVLYVDSLSAPDGVVPTYLDLLRVTTKTIADGFAKAHSPEKHP